MQEYYIVANSCAAPIVSDTTTAWRNGINPEDAMDSFINDYKHPAGLYSANLYKDANSHSKGEEPLIKWLSFKALLNEKIRGGMMVQ